MLLYNLLLYDILHLQNRFDCIWQGEAAGVYRRNKTHVYVNPLYLAGCRGIQEKENSCLCEPPVSGRVQGYTGETKLMFMWTPCIWQGVGI